MTIRRLDPISDRPRVDAFFQAAADYIRIERDADPGPEVTDEFFNDTPPGCDPTQNLRLGLFDQGLLIAVADLAFGYPASDDAYLGLMIVIPAARGSGACTRLLHHVEAEARAQKCKGLCLAVLEANPAARTFWERKGFRTRLTGCPVTLGQKTQMARRMGKALRKL